MAFAKLLKTVFGDRNERVVKGYSPQVDTINALSDEMAALGDEALHAKTEEFSFLVQVRDIGDRARLVAFVQLLDPRDDR